MLCVTCVDYFLKNGCNAAGSQALPLAFLLSAGPAERRNREARPFPHRGKGRAGQGRRSPPPGPWRHGAEVGTRGQGSLGARLQRGRVQPPLRAPNATPPTSGRCPDRRAGDDAGSTTPGGARASLTRGSGASTRRSSLTTGARRSARRWWASLARSKRVGARPSRGDGETVQRKGAGCACTTVEADCRGVWPEHSNLPLFVAGQSLGGGTALRCCELRPLGLGRRPAAAHATEERVGGRYDGS